MCIHMPTALHRMGLEGPTSVSIAAAHKVSGAWVAEDMQAGAEDSSSTSDGFDATPR